MVRRPLLAAAAFVVMEPVTYAAHRWVMHGPGWVLHGSHHRAAPSGSRPSGSRPSGSRPAAGAGDGAAGGRPAGPSRLEANDAFPVAFAGATIVAMAAGTRVRRLGAVVPVATGVTAYGLAYSLVHDVYIHRRLSRGAAASDGAGATGGRVWAPRPLEWLRRAHGLHHQSGGEPYGMLLPIVRGNMVRGNREGSRVAAGPGNGSTVGGIGHA